MKNDLLTLLIKEFASDGIITEAERTIIEKQAIEIGFPIEMLEVLINDQFAGIAGGRETENDDEDGFYSKLNIVLPQPKAAIGDIIYYTSGCRKLPDLLRIGSLNHKNQELNLKIPALIPLFNTNGILLKFASDSTIAPEELIETLVFRLVLSIPNKMVKLHIIDENQGDSIRNILALPKKIKGKEVLYDEQIILEKLKELLQVSEQNRSKYLGSKYSSLAVYNENNKQNQQPYNILVINNFPNDFNKDSCNALLKLIKNGPVAGIYTIISFNTQAPAPYDVDLNKFMGLLTEIDLANNQIELINIFNQFEGSEYLLEKYSLLFDDALPEDIENICHALNEELEKKETLKVDVSKLVSSVTWTNSASEGVNIPIGKTPEGKEIKFVLGLDSNVHHALIGGATGSGKTILLHDIIINGAQLYSPNELQFILMDYKEGTEFKIYDGLPHMKVLSIASNPEFGMSVFEYLIDEIENRGKLFKKHTVSNINDYKRATGQTLPRILIIIDEFQVILNSEGRIGAKVKTMMEDISRRGRSFGVNMILSTQSLGDVDVSNSTLNQIGLRIALKMLDNDCSKILNVNNDAPVYFTRAGQAIYNPRNGLREGNIEFQAAYITNDKITNVIQKLISEQEKLNLPQTTSFVFDGNNEAKIENNKKISELTLEKGKQFYDIYIGEPSFLQEEHIFYRLRKQSAANILIVGEDTKATISIIKNSIRQLIKQCPKESKYYVCSLFPSDSGLNEQLDKLSDLTDNCSVIHETSQVKAIIDNIQKELDTRIKKQNSKNMLFFALANASMARILKKEGYNLSAETEKLIRIIKEGPDYGIHLVFHAISYHSLLEIIENNHLNEFEIKIALKGEDSIKLFDEFLMEPIRNTNDALIKSPWCKYDVDKLKIYSK